MNEVSSPFKRVVLLIAAFFALIVTQPGLGSALASEQPRQSEQQRDASIRQAFSFGSRETPPQPKPVSQTSIQPSVFNGLWYGDVWVQGTIGAGGATTVLEGGVSDLMRMNNTMERTLNAASQKLIYLVHRPEYWTFEMSSAGNDNRGGFVGFHLTNFRYNGTELAFGVRYQFPDGYSRAETYHLRARQPGWLSGKIVIEDYYNGGVEMRYEGMINLFDSPDKLSAFQQRVAQNLKDTGYYESMQRSRDRINGMWSSLMRAQDFSSDLKAASFRYDPNLVPDDPIEIQQQQNAVREALYRQGQHYRAP